MQLQHHSEVPTAVDMQSKSKNKRAIIINLQVKLVLENLPVHTNSRLAMQKHSQSPRHTNVAVYSKWREKAEHAFLSRALAYQIGMK